MSSYQTVPVPYFETIIRYLGGLLSAYALSGDRLLLDRADEMATKLEPIFKSQSGMPYFGINPSKCVRILSTHTLMFNPYSNMTFGPEIGILAEIASLQLEYYYLAKVTGRKSHFKHVGDCVFFSSPWGNICQAHDVMRTLSSANLTQTAGMHPIKWNITSGRPVDSLCTSSLHVR